MRSEARPAGDLRKVNLCGSDVVCLLKRSNRAKNIRIKVTLKGLEVILPSTRELLDGLAFLTDNERWVSDQLERVKRLQSIRRPAKRETDRILFRGESVLVRIISDMQWRGPTRLTLSDGVITMFCSTLRQNRLQSSLENWLRKQARIQIGAYLDQVCKRLKREPNRVYIMGQRTKWGNCSSLGNLSFNWRLIMAPDYVLRYIVTHEVVHLAIPDHSAKFWLTVQSFCPDTERARQWLVSNEHRMTAHVDLLDQ